MGVQNAGAIIREARLKAGLSQEKLSEGICSVLSLSRIENGTAGVSPSTFQALMAHAGTPCEAFPIFASRTDFDGFYTLKRARFYLDCWQLKEVEEELDKIKEMNFAKNKYYYQEWLLLHGKLQFKSGCGNHNDILDTLLEAIHISRPEIDFSDFRELLLSFTEIELLIALAQEKLYLNDIENCLQICTQICTYLENSQFSFLDKDRMLAEYAIVYSKYLLKTEDYSAALKLADTFRQKMIEHTDDAPLHELTFLTGLANFHMGNTEDALLYFKASFFSAHSIESCYATTLQQYLFHELGISLYDTSFEIREIPLVSFPTEKAIDTSDFSDGTYDLFSPETLTLGGLIRELRIEQNISQQTLCLGLCSKSKLSKIENSTQQPDISLAQSLLQRLGISDAVFTFYGNEHEATLHELRQRLTLTPSSDVISIQKYTEELLLLCNDADTFYKQYALYKKASLLPENDKSAEALLQALRITLPDFTIEDIPKYRLSWLELTILNNYCNAYRKYSPTKGTFTLYKVLEYYDSSNLDILEKKRLFQIPFCFLGSVLYKQNRFTELVELEHYLPLPILKCSVNSVGVFLANYSQALGELQQLSKVPLYATYAYYNLTITNFFKDANTLKKWIYEDFNICL